MIHQPTHKVPPPLSVEEADGMIVELVRITPEWAAEMLERNHTNRPLRENVVHRYARDMAAGRWLPGVGSISMDADDNLLNGQHRLQACVIAGVPFDAVLVLGATSATQQAEDTNLRRSLADILAWSGETNVTALAAAINLGQRWEFSNLTWSNLTPSHAEAMSWYAAHPGLRDHMPLAASVRRNVGSPLGPLSNWLFRIHEGEPSEAPVFVAAIQSGQDLDSGHPALAFRSWAINQKLRSSASGKASAVTHLAMLIKAWNAWITGRPLRTLVWRRGGSQAEEFPVLVNARSEQIAPTPDNPNC